MKKTIANTLHSSSFSVISGKGRNASTEIPLRPNDKGVIRLPEVDGKLITNLNHESLKAHEYGHVSLVERDILSMKFIEDMQKIGASEYLTQACMDAAVNSFIGKRSRYLPFEHDLISKKKFFEKFRDLELDSQVSYLLQAMGVYYGSDMHNSLHSTDKELNLHCKKLDNFIKETVRILSDSPMGVDLTRKVNDLVRYCRETLGRSSSLFSEVVFFDYAKRLIFSLNNVQSVKKVGDELTEDLKEYDFPIVKGCAWGKMDIKEMPLENSMMRNWKQVYRPKYMGSLRYMHRAITDMKVWGLKDRSIPPLAVLLDLSGSMNLEQRDIVAILEKHPASIIAGYSGSSETGSVYILGKDGKYASEEAIEDMRDRVGYGNIIDGPALVWLSKQRGRKIWVSDGNITGFQETQSTGMFEFVDEVLKRTGIEMYRSLYNLENEIPSLFRKRTF